jgi:HEAT repeat protein
MSRIPIDRAPKGVQFGMLEYGRMRELEKLQPLADKNDSAGLLRILEESDNIFKLVCVAHLLSDLGVTDAIPGLLRRYEQKWKEYGARVEYIRFWFATALGKLGNPTGFAQLKELIQLGSSPDSVPIFELRTKAVEALAQLQTPEAMELIKVASRDSDRRVKATADQILQGS